MPKKDWLNFDAAGMGFWAILFLIMLGPCVYGSFKIVYEDEGWGTPIAIGFASAAMIAGFISWGVNALLQKRGKKRRIAERKKAKKQK